MNFQLILFFVLAMVQFSAAQNVGGILNDPLDASSSIVGNATGRVCNIAGRTVLCYKINALNWAACESCGLT